MSSMSRSVRLSSAVLALSFAGCAVASEDAETASLVISPSSDRADGARRERITGRTQFDDTADIRCDEWFNCDVVLAASMTPQYEIDTVPLDANERGELYLGAVDISAPFSQETCGVYDLYVDYDARDVDGRGHLAPVSRKIRFAAVPEDSERSPLAGLPFARVDVPKNADGTQDSVRCRFSDASAHVMASFSWADWPVARGQVLGHNLSIPFDVDIDVRWY